MIRCAKREGRPFDRPSAMLPVSPSADGNPSDQQFAYDPAPDWYVEILWQDRFLLRAIKGNNWESGNERECL